MNTITTIGLDIAKSLFQVHGVDAAGEHPSELSQSGRSVAHLAAEPCAAHSAVFLAAD
ncbi:MAG: hypothetical protein JXQ99_16765 [Hyphomicrobiaceae bacterium]